MRLINSLISSARLHLQTHAKGPAPMKFSTVDLFDPKHRFVETSVLRRAYLHYEESRNPTAPTFVTLSDGFELGIVSSAVPEIALAISSILTRSLEAARCDKGGHLPPEVVARVQRDIISPEGVATLWGVAGHRFVLARQHDASTHEIIATILVGRSKDTIFFFTGRYNNLRYSTIAQDVDFDQSDSDDPTHKWFDRFAFPDIQRFKPDRYHHIANFVVSPDHRGGGIAGRFLHDIVRYYSREILDRRGDPIVHSQYLLCGRGFWQIGDPPWMERMAKLGFYRRFGAESFFIEHGWAPLPPVIVHGKRIDNLAYNKMYAMPDCYTSDRMPHPSDEHLLERVPEVVRLARDPRAKLQYFQAMFDFADAEKGASS
jgi:GNAT superfamily N-acetyltransferase